MSGELSQAKAGSTEERMVPARLDWRFLLAEREPDRVAYAGRPDERLLASLRLLCPTVDVLGSTGGTHQGDADLYGLVLAREPSERDLALAAGRVRPGGTLVVEARGPVGALTRTAGHEPPGRIARHLVGLGFEEVRSFWMWPDFERCTRIIPLDDPAAVQHAFAHSRHGAGLRLGAWMAHRLVGMDRIWDRIASSVCIVGRRAAHPAAPSLHAANEASPGPNGTGAPYSSIVHGLLGRRWTELGLDRSFPSRSPSFVVLTPRFRNSSHVIFMLLPEAGSGLVAKVCRQRGPCEKLDLEARNLRAIQARLGGLESIPRPVAFDSGEDHMILLQTTLPGRAMDRATVRRRGPQCCESVLGWLIDVQAATRSTAGPDGFDRLIGGDLSHLQALFPAERDLLERTRSLVAPLSEMSFPLVLEHGDLSHPNLLVGPGDRVGVIDWEQAELRGMPAVDLFFFLGYVGRAMGEARSTDEALRAVDQAFFGRRSWARSYVLRYAERLGLPRETLTPLFISCWARQVAGLARKVASCEDPGSPGPAFLDWLHSNWRFGAWRHAVEQSSRLDWDN